MLFIALQSTCLSSKSSCYYMHGSYHFEFPQFSSLSHQTLVLFHFFPFFFFTLTSTGAAILMLFLADYYYVWSSCLHQVATLNIDIPQHFHSFIFPCVTTFLCVLTHSCYKGPDGISLLHYSVVSYILFNLISHIPLLSVAHYHLFSA